MWYPNMDEKTYIRLQDQHFAAIAQGKLPKPRSGSQGRGLDVARGWAKLRKITSVSLGLQRLAAALAAPTIRKYR